ncbi:MAG TPA: DUF4136 domain-containing protein [Polyangiaceae bacterium]|nr:DUF4136 domain-containing protein [Polyangiaceae bacterium]
MFGKHLAAGALVAAGLSMGACSFEGLTTSETDVVITIEDEERDYSAFGTYALTDQVVDLCQVAGEDGVIPLGGAGGELNLETCFELDHRYDQDLIDAVRRNMEAIGYQEVAQDENPDVTLLLGAVTRNNWFYAYGYWWCDPYYYYYCWYPPVSYVYNLPMGTILLNLIDNSQTTPDGKLTSAWFAALSGLYEQASDKTFPERINEGVDKAFKQSPYLEVQ